MPLEPTIDTIWKIVIREVLKPLGEVLLDYAVWRAREMGFPDPEDAAADAILHLVQVTPADLHRFCRQDGTVDVAGLRAWSRKVIDNHLISQWRKYARNLSLLVADKPALEHQDPHSLRAEQLLMRLDLQIAQLYTLKGLNDEKFFRVVSRLLEITNKDIAVLTEVTEKAIEAFFAWLRKQIGTDFQTIPKNIRRCFRNPADDEPLATADTPKLAATLAASDSASMLKLIDATKVLTVALRFRFLSRLVGYWDCSLASVLHITIPRQELSIAEARCLLEEKLEMPPGSDSERNQTRGRGPGKARSSSPAVTQAEGTRMTTHFSHLTDEGLQALLQSVEQHPGETFTELLQNPDLLESLAAGRRQYVAPQVLPRSLSVAERLWRFATQTRDALQEQLEDAVAWLVPLNPSLVRGHDDEPLVYVFANEVGDRTGQHCVLLQVKGQQFERLYPVELSDESRCEHLQGVEVPLIVASGETHLQLVLLWLPAAEFAKLKTLLQEVTYSERPTVFEAWLKSIMLDAPEGVQWEGIEIEVPSSHLLGS